MGKLRNLTLFISIFYLIFGLNGIWCLKSSEAQETSGKLSRTRYVDPKGYFKITPPRGWRIQEYPQDPRGKVAFIRGKNIDLRVLARAADFDGIEGLLEFVKDNQKQFGVNMNIQKVKLLGKAAVKRNFTFKGFKILLIDFMEGNIKHNLQYMAKPSIYDKYLAIVMESINTYETILRAASRKNVQKHEVAQNLRLAQVFFEKGDLETALEFVTEGLTIDPKNSDLLKLKKQIENKKKKQ
jgi:hypothetical protein